MLKKIITLLIKNEINKELNPYFNLFKWACLGLFLLQGLVIGVALLFRLDFLLPHLQGFLLGSISATVNMVALAYAIYVSMIKDGPKVWVLVPMLSFVMMCVLAFFIAFYFNELLLGFAIGLTVPLFFGMVVALVG